MGTLNKIVGDITGSNQASTAKTGAINAQGYLNSAYSTSEGNIAPYSTMGTSMANMLNNAYTTGNFSQILGNNPGYQFQLQQGQDAIAAQAAANGTYGGGSMGTALQNYSQGLAQTDYNNAFDQANSLMQTGMGATGTMNQYLLGEAGALGNTQLAIANANISRENALPTALGSMIGGSSDSDFMSTFGSNLGQAGSTLFSGGTAMQSLGDLFLGAI